MATGPGYDEQLQGEIGERELTRLAQETRLLAMKAVPDLGGWDFCVQESEAQSDAPLDLRPPGRRWMVQAKTVQRLESEVKVNLLNWRRMATEPVPAAPRGGHNRTCRSPMSPSPRARLTLRLRARFAGPTLRVSGY